MDKPEAPLDERAKLLPCPFCGEEPDMQTRPGYGRTMYRVFCDWGMEHAIFIGGVTEAEAIADWNRRAGQQEQAALSDLSDEQIEKLALEHEDFGFGQVHAGVSTHGFRPENLLAFARAILAASRLEPKP